MVCAGDDLPKEIKGKAIWGRYKEQESAYYINLNGGVHTVEYINNKWYWIDWNGDTHAHHTTSNGYFYHPTSQGLGTKGELYLSQEDARRLSKALSSKLPKSEEEGEKGATETPTRQFDDIPIGNQSDNEELATQVGLKMTTTTVAHARGGEVINLPQENPMQPPIAVAHQMRSSQKEENFPPQTFPYG